MKYLTILTLLCSLAQAQVCPVKTYLKGDTVVVSCDTVIIAHPSKLRATIAFERSKTESLRKLSLDKDRAVAELVKTYEARIVNFEKQVETMQRAYDELRTTTQKELFEARLNIEKATWQIGASEKKATDAVEMAVVNEKELNRRWLKRTFIVGGVGIGVGGILAALIILR